MPLNNSWRSLIAERQDLVASFVLRQLSQREICAALERMGKVNPKTGKPWDVGTINGDLKRLRQRWRDSAQQSIEQHQANRLRELEEVKKAAWQQRDLDKVLRAIKQECDILGLCAPVKIDLILSREVERIREDLALTDEEKRQLIDDVERYAYGRS